MAESLELRKSDEVEVAVAAYLPAEWFATYEGSLFAPVAIGSDDFLAMVPDVVPLAKFSSDNFEDLEEELKFLDSLHRMRPSHLILEGEHFLSSLENNSYIPKLRKLLLTGHSLGFYFELTSEELEVEFEKIIPLFRE